MALAAKTDWLGPEFGPFLRSPLWEERNAMPLSVLSAFARLGLDPWFESASLSRLSTQAAAERLALLFSSLPGAKSASEIDAHCRRSAALLPAPAPLPPAALALVAGVTPLATPSAMVRHFLVLAFCLALATALADTMGVKSSANGDAASQGRNAATAVTVARR